MVAQLSLSMSQSLRYSSAAFIEHAGVREAIEAVEKLAPSRGFSLIYIVGAKGSGKTHLAVYLVGKLMAERAARLVAGGDFLGWAANELPESPFAGGEVLVIDDADRLLETSGASGPFVDVVERLANADGTLVLLGSKLPEQIACAPQCKSRLSAGLHVAIGSPQDADLDMLLDLITKQRGLQLKESKRSYILRRVTRTLPALVECVDKLDEGSELGSSSTSFQALSGALGSLS